MLVTIMYLASNMSIVTRNCFLLPITKGHASYTVQRWSEYLVRVNRRSLATLTRARVQTGKGRAAGYIQDIHRGG